MLRLVSVLKEFPAWEGKIDPSAGSDSHIVEFSEGEKPRGPQNHRESPNPAWQCGRVHGELPGRCMESRVACAKAQHHHTAVDFM